MSSLCDIEIMKVYNSMQLIFDILTKYFINDINVQLSKINEEINKLKNLSNGVNAVEINVDQFEVIKKIHNSPLGLNLLDILKRGDRIELDLLKNLFNIDESVIQYGSIFHDRVEKIVNYGLNKRCSIMIDAEQSYIQTFIDSNARFFSYKYNKGFCTILQTIQCYLKESYNNSQDYLNFLKKNKLKIGMKIVRGAYMTEEGKLAKEFNYENPIFPSIEETHKSYNSLIEKLLTQTNKEDKVRYIKNR